MDQQSTGDRHQAAFKMEQKTGCLDIQLGMRLPWCPRKVGFLNDDTNSCVVTRYGRLRQILKDMEVALPQLQEC